MGSIGLKRAGAHNTPSSSPCRVSGDKSKTCAAREKFSTFPGLPGLRVASTGNNVQCSIIGPSPAPHTNPSTRSRANSLHLMSIYSSHFHSFRTPRQVYLPHSPSRAIELRLVSWLWKRPGRLPREWSPQVGIFAAGRLNTIAKASRVDIPLATTVKYSCIVLYP